MPSASTHHRHRVSDTALSAAKALHAAGNLSAAEAHYHRLIEAHPKAPEPKALLGALLVDQGEVQTALPLLETASRRLRDNADVQYNLGLAQAELGDLQGAIASYRRTLKLNPHHGKAQFNLGLAYRRGGQHEKAIVVLEREFARAPSADAARLLYRSLEHLGRREDALDYARRCVEQTDATREDLNQLVTALCLDCPSRASVTEAMQGELIALAEHALVLAPNSVPALLNAGRAKAQLGLHGDALAHYEKAVQLDPENDTAHQLYAISLLTEGELYRGWHERTLIQRMRETDRAGVPRWQGGVYPGLRLGVINEQGVGDQVLYLRMLEDLWTEGVEVSLNCEPRLKPLLERSLPNVRLTDTVDEALKDVDAFASLGELHLYLRPSLTSLPEPAAYLSADPDQTHALRAKWSALYPDRRFTGITWLSHSADLGASKSVSLDALLPVLTLPDRVFVCTQYGSGWAALTAHAAHHGYRVHHDPECNAREDIDAGAAQLAALDDLVSVSNASVHTAGALGVATHVLIGRRPVWHWFSSGETSPWYPSVNLYRQATLSDWDAPIQDLTAALAARS